MKEYRFFLLLFFLLLIVFNLFPEEYCVTVGGNAANDGLSWSNPTTFNSANIWDTIGAGDIIFIAQGEYSGTDWEIKGSNIKIRKATRDECGLIGGWVNSLDEGDVLLNGIGIRIETGVSRNQGHDNIEINGADDRDGDGVNDYLFTINKSSSIDTNPCIRLTNSNYEYPSDNITISDIVFISQSVRTAIIDTVGAYSPSTNINISDCTFSGPDEIIILGNCGIDDIPGVTIKNNIFYDMGTNGIRFFSPCTNIFIYGNLFYQTGIKVGTGTAIATDGQSINNMHIYNNTFVDFGTGINTAGSNHTDTDGDFIVHIKNNLFYNNSTHLASYDLTGHDYNWFSGTDYYGEGSSKSGQVGGATDPFVSGSFLLSNETNPGERLTSPAGVETDMREAKRGHDTKWDRGAYEYDEVRSIVISDDINIEVDEIYTATDANDPVSLYAVAYNDEQTYDDTTRLGPVEVEWTIRNHDTVTPNPEGYIDNTDFVNGTVEPSTGNSVQFYPNEPGSPSVPEDPGDQGTGMVIQAEYLPLGFDRADITDTTGIITVAGPLAFIKITDENMVLIDNYIFEMTDPAASPNPQSIAIYAREFDSDVTYRGKDVNATWSLVSTNRNHAIDGVSPEDTVNFSYGSGDASDDSILSRVGSATITIDATIDTNPYRNSGVIYVTARQNTESYDIVHVLDRSGSMGGAAYSGSPTRKIDALHDAAHFFVSCMNEDADIDYGMVIFDHESYPLQELQKLDAIKVSPDTTVKQDVLDILESRTVITPRGSTSIGGGLGDGATLLGVDSDTNNKEAILLVTDGRQNTDPDLNDFLTNHYYPLAAPEKFFIHIIAIGHDWGVDEDRLKDFLDLLDSTAELREMDGHYHKGSYRRLDSNVDLPIKIMKAFNEILLQSTDATLASDPIFEIQQGNDPVKVPVTLSSEQTSASFAVYWQGAENALDVKIKSPGEDGITIDQDTLNNRVEYGKHPLYCFYNLSFPLSGELFGKKEGEWTLVIAPASTLPEGQVVKVTSSIAVKGGVELEAGFEKDYIVTGEPITVRAKVLRDGNPLPGIKMEAICDIPLNGIGNVLHDSDIGPVEIPDLMHTEWEDMHPVDFKIKMIEDQKGSDLIERTTDRFELFDDGMHNDGEPDDGIYANTYNNTTIPGIYDFRFVASEIPLPTGETTTREWTNSISTEVNVNESSTPFTVDITNISDDGITYMVRFIPKDRYNNYLGPGYPVTARVFTPNPGTIYEVSLKDNQDGTYYREISLSHDQIAQKPEIEIKIDGDSFTEKSIPTHFDGSISIHGGTNIPLTALANNFDTGASGIVDLGYNFTPGIGLVALIGYNLFRSKTTGIEDLHLFSALLDLKYRFWEISQTIDACIIGGGGIYLPWNSSIDFGVNIGVAFDYIISTRLSLDINIAYHYLVNRQEMFLQTCAGIIWHFQFYR